MKNSNSNVMMNAYVSMNKLSVYAHLKKFKTWLSSTITEEYASRS